MTEDMTEEEINRAIAEHLGWRRVRSPMQNRSDPEPKGWLRPGETNHWNACAYPPFYASDLNACAEMWKSMNGDQSMQFAEALLEITGATNTFDERWGLGEIFRAISATPRHQCEAFLRTVGKWSASPLNKSAIL